MINSAGDIGIDMITNQINQLLVDRVNSAKWKLSPIVSCIKGIVKIAEPRECDICLISGIL